ncbi:MAG: hypothetical protein U1E16_14835 [Hyphomicrobiales bacterium]
MMPLMDLGAFSLRQYIVELRYPENFKLWDEAGSLWTELKSQFSGLRLISAQPNSTAFVCDPDLEFGVDLNRMSFVSHREKAEAARENATKFLSLVTGKLKIRQFHRVGLRQIFDRKFESQEKLDAEFIELNLSTLRAGKFFGIQSKSISNSEIAGRISDGKNGVVVKLKTETVRSQLDVPMGLRDLFSDKSVEQHLMILDVDYYIDALVSSDAFSADVWLEQASRVIRRDMSSFLRGGS